MIQGEGRVPHDAQLEREVLGGVIHRYALNTQVRPEHFYVPAHALIFTAWLRASRPTGRYVGIRDGDEVLVGVRYEGLARQLLALDPVGAERLEARAAIIAAAAPVTTRHDVACLRLLAYRRRRLARLEDERLHLLGVV